MVCMGSYRRNVLTLSDTILWLGVWCLSGVIDVTLHRILPHYKGRPLNKSIFSQGLGLANAYGLGLEMKIVTRVHKLRVDGLGLGL